MKWEARRLKTDLFVTTDKILSQINPEFYLLGYNAVQPVKNQQTFRRNMSPSTLSSKNKLSKTNLKREARRLKTELFVITDKILSQINPSDSFKAKFLRPILILLCVRVTTDEGLD
jgi:hypothetical protein